MGRPRHYATAAERQAAYRQRMTATTLRVDRIPFARIDGAIIALQEAMWRAHIKGNPLARALYHSNAIDTLEATVAWILPHLQPGQRPTDDTDANGRDPRS